ncbi:uncharacterized protein LOC130818830 isoform X1 [Amaranthus tricolor]|uniref:uncharacterized protein LOC130818830 isoform X1 n=1 Tax=Amaranthus tricolor TaxID=29722 RepID=UPI00259012C7|nr:uncharacterized protein LOC130818830 isoform X1 [Amaranthus tricolor]
MAAYSGPISIARFIAIGIVVMGCIIGFGSSKYMVMGQSCAGDIPNLASQCVKYVLTVGPKTPPSSRCCSLARNVDMQCLCKYVNKGIEKFVSVDKALYLAQYCGIAFQHGAKCGSYTIP